MSAAAVGGDAVLIERTVRVEDFDQDDDDDDNDDSFRRAIPIMSRRLAVVCAVCNVLTPGLGELETHACRPAATVNKYPYIHVCIRKSTE